MEFSIKNGNPEKQRHACIMVGIFESRKFSLAASLIDRCSGGYIGSVTRRGDMDGRLGSTLLLHNVPGTLCDRVLLVGLGKERDFRDSEYRKAVAAAVKAMQNLGADDAASFLAELPVKKRDLAWKVAQHVAVAAATAYRFSHPQCKTERDAPVPGLKSIVINVPHRPDLRVGEAALKQGWALASGMRFARDLANLPANFCTPTWLAEQATVLAQQYGMPLEVLERETMEQLGMGSFLSVSSGSRQPPKMIVLQHRQGGNAKPVVLVGKGITFDTGGISLKPPADMDEMKFDMCGAASVLGVMKAVAMLDLPLNVIAIVPTCENMPDGNATRPGDVVTSMSGLTIEILNTDAEGRLILCDALTYAERFEPAVVIDVATLTGACVVALGHHASGLFGNNEGLVQALEHAGQESGDRAWPMPLWDDYQEQLKSNFADLANIGGRAAGSVTAACFLSRFTKKFDWAHLDIAGTAYLSGKEKGATGRPVPLLLNFLLERAEQA